MAMLYQHRQHYQQGPQRDCKKPRKRVREEMKKTLFVFKCRRLSEGRVKGSHGACVETRGSCTC